MKSANRHTGARSRGGRLGAEHLFDDVHLKPRSVRQAEQVLDQFRIGSQLAGGIPRFGFFHLDDFGAHMRQLMATERSGQNVDQIENAEIARRLHRRLP